MDLGFLGTDKLGELAIGRIDVIATLFEPVSTPRFVLAGRAECQFDIPTKLENGEPLTVATSYPKALALFAQQNKKWALDITYTPDGSAEAYPAGKLTDLCFDITCSGKTLEDNKLKAFEWGSWIGMNVVRNLRLEPPVDFEAALDRADATVQDRYRNPTDSYTSRLLQNDNNARKKVGEEAVEFALASAFGSISDVVNEGADVAQIMRVNLTRRGTTFKAVLLEDIRRNKDAI